MKILFVNHTSIVSGAEHSLLTLIGGLPPEIAAGLACPAGPLAEIARERGIDVHLVRGTAGSLRLHPWHTPVAVVEIALSGVQVARVARRTGASILHANSLRASLATCIACRMHRYGFVAHVRDCLPDSTATRLIRHLVARQTDQVVAISEYVAKRFRAGLSNRDVRLRIIDNPVDLDRFQANLNGPDAPRPPDEPILVIVGQISSWKGHDTAIRALHNVRSHYPKARLQVVGDVKFDSAGTRFDNRGYLAELHRLVSELGLGNAVDFVGERNDIPQIMARADVVLAPSIEEPFGRTVAEAMAVGTPVIATTVGGPAELIEDGTTGLLAPPGEPPAWSSAILRILDHPIKAREMGRNAVVVAHRRFATDRHVATMMEVYDSVALLRKQSTSR
jgi:glycosyltransferase involved in cell wall biosynthesis